MFFPSLVFSKEVPVSNPDTPIERERRWLVRSYNQVLLSGLIRNLEAQKRLSDPVFSTPERIATYVQKHIVQGYFDVLGERSFRVRIIDDRYAVVTLKEGSGEVRFEHELPIDLAAARVMLEATSFQVTKTRHVADGWELDIFEGPLTGIVILEYEAKGDEPIPPLPTWIENATDVTDSLTNLHLARMAKEIGDDAIGHVSRYLEPKLPKLVLTGGPCSGKSTLMQDIIETYGDLVHCVPEVATILISQVGLTPSKDDTEHNWKFQRLVYRVQRSFEEAAELQAIKDGKKAIILDRGTVDAVAYFEGHANGQRQAEFEAAIQTSVLKERERYACVLFLDVPPKDVFEANHKNNPARQETYAEAVALSARTHDAWYHLYFPEWTTHSFRNICGETWQAKRDCAFAVLDSFLRI